MSFFNTVLGKILFPQYQAAQNQNQFKTDAENAFRGQIGSQSQIPGFQQYQQRFQQAANTANTQAGQVYGQDQAARRQEQGLANILAARANGVGGPSLAEQQLAQTTQGNIANAYAMAQGHPRDAGAVRNIANQVGNLNQQANQQGAMLRSQEQQQAQGMLGQVLGGMRGQDLGSLQGEQQTGLGYSQLGQQGAEQQAQDNLDVTRIMSGIDQQNQARQDRINGSIMNAAGGVASGVVGAAQAGGVGQAPAPGGQPDPGAMNGVAYGAEGGEVHPMAHHGVLSFLMGGGVPGHASMTGNSLKNDTVPAMLSPGEIVLPRSVTQDEDAPQKARMFVEAIRAKKKSAA